MTLNIHTQDIENGQELWLDDKEQGGKYLNGTTYTLGMMSVACGFNEITSQNAAEVFRRVHAQEMYYGAMRGGPDGPVFFTRYDVARHIGMKTNATAYSNAKFDKNMRDIAVRDAKAEARREAEKAEAGKTKEVTS